jgi:hypothetical protein
MSVTMTVSILIGHSNLLGTLQGFSQHSRSGTGEYLLYYEINARYILMNNKDVT